MNFYKAIITDKVFFLSVIFLLGCSKLKSQQYHFDNLV